MALLLSQHKVIGSLIEVIMYESVYNGEVNESKEEK
jgi:hypothetical protein